LKINFAPFEFVKVMCAKSLQKSIFVAKISSGIYVKCNRCSVVKVSLALYTSQKFILPCPCAVYAFLRDTVMAASEVMVPCYSFGLAALV
jgi:hypothetical protein